MVTVKRIMVQVSEKLKEVKMKLNFMHTEIFQIERWILGLVHGWYG